MIDGLLPDGTKPLPEPMLTYDWWGSVALTLDQFHRRCSRYQLVKWIWTLCFTITSTSLRGQWVNTLGPRQNGRHFADDIFECIFVNENVWVPIIISLKFVPKGPINNIPALVQIMAWRRSGDKPLSGTILVSLLTHICVTRPQWVNVVEKNHITLCFDSIMTDQSAENSKGTLHYTYCTHAHPTTSHEVST